MLFVSKICGKGFKAALGRGYGARGGSLASDAAGPRAIYYIGVLLCSDFDEEDSSSLSSMIDSVSLR